MEVSFSLAIVIIIATTTDKKNQISFTFFSSRMQYVLMIVIPLLIAIVGLLLFRKFHILDRPGSDLKNTRKPVPTLQGVFVILGVIVTIALMFPSYFSNPLFLGLVIPGLLIGGVELLEELSYLGKMPKIPPIVRLFVHCGAAFLAVWIAGL